jgi:alginate O-acetyltransferase complex protein AlgI
MLFTDPLFLFYFLPLSLILVRLSSRGQRLYYPAKIAIIAATLIFYAYQNWTWPLLFLLIVCVTWLCSWAINLTEDTRWRRIWLITGIGTSFAALFLFKFLNWLAGLMPVLHPLQAWLASLFGADGLIILPPGISFFVFEAVSFTIDQYHRKFPFPKSLDYLSFLAMFPRFVAGPIVRYNDVSQQLLDWPGMRLARGLSLFALGYMLKVLGADQFAVFVPYAFTVPNPDIIQAWTGALAYTFQLYLDFWGYSLMATGLGLCLGFEFPDNFRSPYSSWSIGEFWRRWHITLSTWIRDYIFIPLGGSRASLPRTCTNLLLAMGLAGLWHGASFTFVVWGLYHGSLLVAERCLGENLLGKVPRQMRVMFTFFLVVFGWVLFRSANFDQARAVLAGMFGVHGLMTTFSPVLLAKNGFAALFCGLGVIFVLFLERRLIFSEPIATRDFSFTRQLLLALGFAFALMVSTSNAKIPFLYFQF